MVRFNSLGIERFFPNTSTLAYYDFLDQVININSLDLDKLEAIKARSNFEKTKAILPLCQHEYTHWLDNTSTLWGIKFLNTLYKTYDIEDCKVFLNGNNDFNNLQQSIFKLREHHINTSLNDNHENTIPWRYQYEYKVVNNHLKMIVNFLDSTYTRICSVPLTILSILESSAIGQELNMSMRLVFGLLDKGENIVEAKVFERELVQQIYNKNLTEYSVAVHIIANSIQTSDILFAYNICSVLGRFILNFPTKYFEKISLYSSISDLNFLTIENYELFEKSIHEQDLSLLYYIIASKMKNHKIDNNDNSIKEAIKSICITLSVDVDHIFESAVEDEFKNYYDYFKTYDYEPIELLVEAGFNNFKSIGIYGQSFYDFHTLETPKALLGDDSECPCFKTVIQKFSPRIQKEHLYDASHATISTFNILYERFLQER